MLEFIFAAYLQCSVVSVFNTQSFRLSQFPLHLCKKRKVINSFGSKHFERGKKMGKQSRKDPRRGEKDTEEKSKYLTKMKEWTCSGKKANNI